MSSDEVEVLGGAPNAIVAKARTREFPGVLLQGDTLDNLLSIVEEIREAAKDSQEVIELSEEAREILKATLEIYERVMADRGFALPYVRTRPGGYRD